MVSTASKPEGPTDEFTGDIEVSNKLPSKGDLEKTADLPVLDALGKAHTFKSLHDGPRRVLVIFIRHFFCGVSTIRLTLRDSKVFLTMCRIARSIYELSPLSSRPSHSLSSKHPRRSSSLDMDTRM